MKNKLFKILSVFLTALMVACALSACSGSAKSSADAAWDEADYHYSEAYYGAEDGNSGYTDSSSANGSSSSAAQELNRKIIVSYSYSVESEDMDTFVTAFEAKIKELGGYIQNCQTYRSATSSYASTDYSVKIPTEKNDVFCEFIEENAHVLSSSIDSDDVTMNYIDTESRLKALRLEQESLEKLLKDANEVADIIEVQDRLSDVIYEIESYESRLRQLDADIDFTSFSVDVRKVSQETVAAEDSIWEKIGKNLAVTFEGIGDFFEDFLILIVSTAPVFLILGMIGLVIFLIVRGSIRLKRKKRAKKAAQGAVVPPTDDSK